MRKKEEIAIQLKGVKKRYQLGQIGGGTLQGDLQSWWARVRGKEDPNTKIEQRQRLVGKTFMALNGVDLTIDKGEAVGIIGGNGAGKSTMLKLLSRVTAPTEGSIEIYGRIASMLEVGTGFNGEMTGRENVYMNGAILGMTEAEIDAKMDKIIEFFYMFNPDLMKWKPQCDIFPMDKISCENPEFKRKVNLLFGYRAKFNEYDTKYIFFEESFLAEGTEINDIDLVNKIAARVGKENIMIKIHPRNPVNRFEKLGYKTNQCTYIPWEVILMNMEDLSDKIFITVASACVLNPFLTFHREVRAYSLYYCINQIPPILQNGLWEFVEEIYRQHQDKIRICRSVEEVN